MKKQLNNLATNLSLMELKEDEVAEYKAKTDGLKTQLSALEVKISELDREINALEHQHIDGGELPEVFQDFSEIYAEATTEIKRRLLNVVIEEIRCKVRRRENSGETTFKLRGDGSIKKDWSEAVKTKEDSSTSTSAGLSPHTALLREQDSN